MPFVGTISNQSAIRSGANFQRHLIVHTPDVVCQVQPSSGSTGLSNAVIEVGTPSSGSLAAIELDYTVFITPTADYANDIQTLGSGDYLITYARGLSGSTEIYIGETTFQWSTSDYVTVVKDVRIHQRKLRYTGDGIEYRDYNITYRAPKPRIYDLYSEALEITSGSTVSKSFTPSADSMSGGSISTWAWDVDGNTISTGTASSQNITVDFTAGTHLVQLTVTDSNGISNKLSVLIAVIPLDYNSVLETGVIVASLSHNEDGHAAGFEKLNDIEPLLPGSMAIVCTKVNFEDGTSTLTTDMVGWLGEISTRTVGDETWQRLRFANFGLLDVGFLMSNITLQSLPFERVATPDAWGELASCTPLEMAWSLISEQSTVPNVAAVDFPSGYANQTVKSYDTPNGTLIDIMRTLAFNNNAGSLQFAPNGELVFDVSLPYEDTTDRDAATTVVTLTTQDSNIELSYPSAGVFAVRYVNAGATRYDTTELKMRDFYGRAPAEVENGILEERLDYMVFTEDTSVENSIASVGRLAYNHWEAINENLSGSLDNMLGGYLELRQQQNVWLKLSISAGDLLNSDLSFGASDRFIITGISQEYDVERGSLTCSASIRYETGNKDNYSVLSQELLASELDASQGVVPNVPAYPQLEGSPEDTTDTYGDDYNDATAGMPDPADEPTTTNQSNDPSDVLEKITIPLSGGVVTSVTEFAIGDYLVTLAGKGKVGTRNDTQQQSQVDSFSVDASNSSFTVGSATLTSGGFYIVEISGSIQYSSAADHFADALYSTTDAYATRSGPAVTLDVSAGALTPVASAYNPSHVYRFEYTGQGAPLNIRYRDTAYGDNTGSFTVTIYDAGTVDVLGDSFFKIDPIDGTTAWGGAAGMQFNGGNLALASVSPSEYSGNNTYTYVVSIAGAATNFTWEFVDGDGSYSENSGNIIATVESV